MKYPLRVVKSLYSLRVCDASGKVICHVEHRMERAEEFAEFIARATNGYRWWWRLPKWFRPYTREDWEWERNVKTS